MPPRRTDPIEIVMWALLASWIAGCGKAPGCPRTVAPAAAPLRMPPPVPSSAPSREMSFGAFECTKMETEAPPAVAAACGPKSGHDTHAAATGIRVWNGGGPEGSNWNVDALTCAAEVHTECDGATTVIMKVGNRELGRAAFERREQTPQCRFVLPRQSWERELDAGEDLPFRTGIFRVEAYQTCSDSGTMVRAADHFVAGFAWGE